LTFHQVAFDLAATDRVPGSHEPPAHAVVFVDEELTVVHSHDFLDKTNTCDL
jgi:hypothetical protein